MSVLPSRADTNVHVAYASTSVLSDPALAASAFRWLDEAERDRYTRYRHDVDRQMFLLGRLMARVLVGRALGVPPRHWTWRDSARGRPEIAEPVTGVRFNIAHSAGLVVCGVASGRDVGVDVEFIDRRHVEPDLVRRYCSAREVADIDLSAAGWHDRFLAHWTLKEAYLKATGLGIAVTLADLGFSIAGDRAQIAFTGSLAGCDDRWAFHLARPVATHVIAVAASTTDDATPSFHVAPLDAAATKEMAQS